MYQVVIIDDEPIIVKGLSQTVPWEEYGCRVAGTATDGQEGLELIRELKPDIVFTDIYMPRIDGLTMAAALKSEFEDMELAVLTGYRDFDLAQRAISLGVARFLLKPSNMEDIREALWEMTNRLKKKGIRGMDVQKEQGSGGPAEGAPEAALRGNTAGSFIVKAALDYMKENYSRKMTLGDVADHIYVSQWHLSKLLNRHTGQSFSELLNNIRIQEAKTLLRDPALRVGDVAERVGFMDMAHFSRVFKKITGMSANEYRNHL